MQLTWDQARAFRMRRHALVQRAPHRSMIKVAGQLCGLHAQLFSSAELSLWARVDGLSRDAVQRAVWKDRTLVKTWAMRGTLHLLPREDLPVWFGALGSYRHHLKQGWVRYFGITVAQLEQVIAVVSETVRERAVTREELAREVEQRTGSRKLGSAVRQSWGLLLKPAAYRGQLCFAPSAGQKVRFTHPGRIRSLGPEESLREVVRRYLTAYGPAGRDDLARWWGGFSAPHAQRLIESVGGRRVDIEGTQAWLLEADAALAARSRAPRSARLLPAFDPYVIGASRTKGFFSARHKARIYRPQGWISPVLLVDGHVEGVWRHARKGNRVWVEIERFGKQPAWVRAQAEEEAEGLAKFLDARLERLTWG